MNGGTFASALTLNGGDAADTVTGGNGNDTINGGTDTSNDIVNGGPGTDTLVYTGVTRSPDRQPGSDDGAERPVAAGSDTITNFENLTGGSGADTLTGSSGANTINGAAGDDIDQRRRR